jgi:hypothetical protein
MPGVFSLATAGAEGSIIDCGTCLFMRESESMNNNATEFKVGDVVRGP